MRPRLALAAILALAATAAPAETPVPPAVAAVMDGRLPVGNGLLPLFVSPDWAQALPQIRRAVVIVHGYARNAGDYARDVTALAPPADTLVVAPQFLAVEDIAAHQLPDAVLRWRRERWSDGDPAEGPDPASAFDALDALLGKLNDPAILPNLSQVVLAGFSAGGQLVQRYAIVGKGELGLRARNIRLRYVVGSPSSFAYLTDERPRPDGTLARFADTAACPGFNRWKYGFAGGLPPYVAAVAALGTPGLERRYVARDVVYLVGADDTDPQHRFLDTSCAAEAQGPTRLARMRSFFAELKLRDGAALGHQMRVVAGAAHNAAKVLGSPCGRAALFGDGDCPGN